MGRLQLAPVAQGLTDFEAKVVTARLGADGILWELRGIVDSVYPLGRIDVLVPVDELEAARQSLVFDEADLSFDQDGDVPSTTAPGTARGAGPWAQGATRRWWVTLAVIAGAVAFSAARFAGTIAWIERDGGDECSPLAAAEGLTARCRR